MSIDLPEKEFLILPRRLAHKNISFQKKREFHITLFSWMVSLTSEVSAKIDRVLCWYKWLTLNDIELQSQLYHIQKWEKHSLICPVTSNKIEEILFNMHSRIANICIMKQPFLHITLYTTDKYPRGISLHTLGDFKNHNKWELYGS